jgi:hypothetical protein
MINIYFITFLEYNNLALVNSTSRMFIKQLT